MDWPHPLKQWDRGFEFHSRHWCLYCVRLVCVCVAVCVGREALRRAVSPSEESYPLCIGSRNLRSDQGPTKGCKAIVLILTYLRSWALLEEPPTSILWNPKVQYRVHKSPPLVPILSHINPFHSISSYLSKIHFNIVHPHSNSGDDDNHHHHHQQQSIIYLFTCWAQQPVANYRVSTKYKINNTINKTKNT
jgi:hypothetical protein